ncbi:MAG TPA: ThiF family adenylyltransferase [Steroidobacteraceae bacterium]|nr:ThiF family adenylyltransferase [Steroidobacteraceae bacterium]
MKLFELRRQPIEVGTEQRRLADPACGGYAAFEGWVRDHNEGQRVTHLEYEAFEPLAIKEGERILAEALERFGVEHAACVHRIGDLALGELAVWVGVSARHRQEAFLACRYIIDEVKHRVPIWKKEHYQAGDSGWVNCERCAEAAQHSHEHGDAGVHSHHAHAAVPDYSRQMALREVGPLGQARLRASRVLVVGAGGLGVPVLTYLAGAGVGRIGIVDGDRLEPSNLHRQTLYALSEVGELKAELAARRLRALNPEVHVQVHAVRLDAHNGAALLEPYELVIDCTDNFGSKFLLNDLCVRLGKPAILSSVYQFEGQLQVLRADSRSACLRCIWPEATRDGLVGNCAEAGVLGPVPGVFGSLQALEALKLLLDLPGQLDNELLVLDLTQLSVTRVRARRAAECASGSCVRSAHSSSPPEPSLELSFATLAEAERRGFTLVDVREPHELAAAPAPAQAVRSVPLQRLLYEPAQLDLRGRYLLLCASGRRSLAAAQQLRARGHDAVYSLRGGLQALDRLPA